MFPAATLPLESLHSVFGETMQTDVSLARHTAARVGGPADAVVTVNSVDELAWAATELRALEVPFLILGGGSNVLISDAGVRGVVVLNRARQISFDDEGAPPTVWAASGANLGKVARRAASRGLSGLEWAAGIPGTVGGAVFGNAGAHGGDVAGCLIMAEILHQDGKWSQWSAEEMGFAYRSSRLKREPITATILSARFALAHRPSDEIQKKMDAYAAFRRRTQPPGASMGSMFENPPGDFAGRLIEEAGLKGTRVGDAEISPMHANFFINHGDATAEDIFALIELARKTVAEKFGVELELEIELVGEW